MSFADLEAGRSVAAPGRRDQINGTQAVAAGVFQINTAVSTFQRLVNTIGTPKDTPALRDKLHKTRLHIGQLVKDTSAKLKQASEIDHAGGISTSKKITDAKLAKDFQAVLKEFQKAQRLAAERESAYAPLVPQPPPPSRFQNGAGCLRIFKLSMRCYPKQNVEGVASSEMRWDVVDFQVQACFHRIFQMTAEFEI